MPDDENDIRIREAADNYHPAYDDTAWNKMEKLLDEHLPQKKRRKPIFFLLLFLLLMGGLVFLMMLNNGEKNSSETSGISIPKKLSPKLNDIHPPSSNSSEESINIPLSKPGESEKNKASLQIIPGNSEERNSNKTDRVHAPSMINNGNELSNNKENLKVKPGIQLKRGSIEKGNNDNNKIKSEPNYTGTSENESFNKSNNIVEENESKTEPSQIDKRNKTMADTEIKKQDTTAKNTNSNSEIIKKKTKSKNSFQNNFGISLSAGPGISGVNNAGKVALVYGVGLSYSISKKFTIRSGFYMSKMIYSTGPDDYHFPNGGGSNYGNLQSVDANCNVAEIPLKLYYSFGKVKNHNWHVSAGLSSYLMKKESYEYYYKTPSGVIYKDDWSVKNKNKNIFSLLDFSAGYQHNFNNRVSIIAEPYISLPLSGVGAGKVKLNSGGILFTITMKPLLKK